MANLRGNGASGEEVAFMFQDFDRLRSTRRVELNAMTSPQFIAFVERKLKENGVKKIIPADHDLADAYRSFVRSRAIEKIIDRELEKFNAIAAAVPADLASRVRKHLAKHPSARWDAAVKSCASGQP